MLIFCTIFLFTRVSHAILSHFKGSNKTVCTKSKSGLWKNSTRLFHFSFQYVNCAHLFEQVVLQSLWRRAAVSSWAVKCNTVGWLAGLEDGFSRNWTHYDLLPSFPLNESRCPVPAQQPIAHICYSTFTTSTSQMLEHTSVWYPGLRISLAVDMWHMLMWLQVYTYACCWFEMIYIFWFHNAHNILLKWESIYFYFWPAAAAADSSGRSLSHRVLLCFGALMCFPVVLGFVWCLTRNHHPPPPPPVPRPRTSCKIQLHILQICHISINFIDLSI